MKEKNPTAQLVIPKEGLLLQPGRVYLARTVERTFTDKYVPMLEGRSSVGRLGISVHVTAGFGDIGFNGHWTLEITVEQPTVIYPDVEICQIYYHTIKATMTCIAAESTKTIQEFKPVLCIRRNENEVN